MMKSGVLVLVLLACFQAGEVVARGLSFGFGGSFPLEETSQVNSGATPTDAAAPTGAPTGVPVIVRGEAARTCADSTEFRDTLSQQDGAVAAGVLVDVTADVCEASCGAWNEVPADGGVVAMIWATIPGWLDPGLGWSDPGETKNFQWGGLVPEDYREARMHGCYIQMEPAGMGASGVWESAYFNLFFNPSITTAITQHHQDPEIPRGSGYDDFLFIDDGQYFYAYDYAICVHTGL